jgi:hypothetical protein
VIVTEFTRSALAYRREVRDLTKQGYRQHETDWELHRGWASWENARSKDGKWRIVDAKISQCGKYVYTKLGKV